MAVEPWYESWDIARPDPAWPWCMQPNAFMLTHIGGGMVTNYFIHIGIPHTGGGSFHAWLPKVKGLRVINREGHRPYSYSAAKCREAGVQVPPAFTFIRNPWAWNVSIWCWIRRVNRKWFCGNFDDLLEFQRYSRHWAFPDINISGLTAVWEYLEADNATYIGKLENYENDAIYILKRLKVIPNLISEQATRKTIRKVGKVNHTEAPDGPRRPYQEYYSPAQRKMVAELEAAIIERFSYTFD